MHRSSLTTPDGVPLAVYEAGDPAGPEILFIHGFSQSARRYLRGRRTFDRSRATVPCAYRTIRWLARFQFRRIASTEPAGSRASSYKATV
jgi:pimeloyl-ACP methyl ester carboxylesterase